MRGGRTESDRIRLCQLFGPQTYLQWVQRPQLVYSGFNCQFQRKLYFLVPKGVQHFPGVGVKVSKGAKIRNRYNQVPHLTQDTYGKVTNSQ